MGAGCGVVASLMLVVSHAHAQPRSVQVIPPSGGDTLASVTPTFVVIAVGAGPGPFRYRFELDTTRTFARPLLDTAFVVNDSAAAVRPTRALPAGTRIYWRATVLDPAGGAATSPIGGPRVVPRYVSPVQPSFSGTVVYTRRPTFVWRSPQVAEPPGPWLYTLQITNQGRTVREQDRITDTTYTPPPGAELEINASYSWAVTARLPATGQAEQITVGVFSVIDSLVVPTATLVYQNFPNPFPNARRESTCIWLDIARPTRARLEILTLRGVRVRRFLPDPELGELLAPRRYGPDTPGTGRWCDPRFEWDGRDDRGEYVPAGVYLLRFQAEGTPATVRKILFRGR